MAPPPFGQDESARHLAVIGYHAVLLTLERLAADLQPPKEEDDD